MSADERDRQTPRLSGDDSPQGTDFAGQGGTGAEATAATGGRQSRDSADIAQLLRALNDDLRDDPPRPPRDPARRDVRQRQLPFPDPVGDDDQRPQGPAADADGAAARTDGRSEIRPGAMPSAGYDQHRSAAAGDRRPPLAMIAIGLLAVAAMGLAAVMISGGPKTAPNDTVTPLIVATPSTSAPDAAAPTATTSSAAAVTPAAPAASASPFPPAPMVALPQTPNGRNGLGLAGNDPGEGTVSVLNGRGPTTTVVRPLPETTGSTSATVMVAPSPAPPASTVTPAPVRPTVVRPSPAAVPAPAPAPVKAAPAPAASASPAAASGGPGHFAVQVGSYSVTANADAEVQRLIRQGWHAYAVDWEDSQQRKWRAVRVGNYPTDAAARKAQADIKARLAISGQVVSLR